MRTVQQEEFDEALAEADTLVLVDFWADWCGPCKVVTPILEEIEMTYGQRVAFWMVNADENRGLMQAFGIRSLPSVLLLRPRGDGGASVIGHLIGAQPASTFVALLESGLNPKPTMFQKIARWFGKT